jgi:hypothetical protein
LKPTLQKNTNVWFCTNPFEQGEEQELDDRLYELLEHAAEKLTAQGMPCRVQHCYHGVSGKVMQPDDLVVSMVHGGMHAHATSGYNRSCKTLIVTTCPVDNIRHFCKPGRSRLVVSVEEVTSNLRSFKKLLLEIASIEERERCTA